VSDPRLAETVQKGFQRDSLVAIRDLLAVQLESASGREAAVIARELRETLRELQALGGAEVDDVDELAARRSGRRSGAAAQ
jgi:hypothetical protein